jgi:NifB/MoaA-like Fe-S oxidoreductase
MHRRKLPELREVDSAYARAFITEWEPRIGELKKQMGKPFLFLADEFYLKVGLTFPPLRDYGDLPQTENGVGMLPLFLRDAARTLRTARRISEYRVTVVTGVSAFAHIADFLSHLSAKTGLEIVPVTVENKLFGSSVTVSGLVCGRDIINALKGLNIGRALLVPDVMLKEGEGVFLDDVSLEKLELEIGCGVMPFDTTPQGLYRTLRRL